MLMFVWSLFAYMYISLLLECSIDQYYLQFDSVLHFHSITETSHVIYVNTSGSNALKCCQHGSRLRSSLDSALKLIDPSADNVTIAIVAHTMITLNSTHEVRKLSVFKLISSRRGDVNCNGGGIAFRDIKAIELDDIVWIM